MPLGNDAILLLMFLGTQRPVPETLLRSKTLNLKRSLVSMLPLKYAMLSSCAAYLR